MTKALRFDQDDSDADGLHWELTPQQSAGFGRAIGAALDRDLAVGMIDGRAERRLHTGDAMFTASVTGPGTPRPSA